jgi:hypothetical protein
MIEPFAEAPVQAGEHDVDVRRHADESAEEESLAPDPSAGHELSRGGAEQCLGHRLHQPGSIAGGASINCRLSKCVSSNRASPSVARAGRGCKPLVVKIDGASAGGRD